MISYMSDLMEDTTDFSWQNAKAADAVLCCELVWDMVSWENIEQIYRIWYMHVQKHTATTTKSWSKADSAKKPWFCRLFQNGTCQYTKDYDWKDP